MRRLLPVAALLALATAAGREAGPPAPTPAAEPRPLPVPTTPGARLPRLSAGEESVFLSWVEPVADGRHALRYASLGPGGWSPPVTAAEGGSWFVNWADFPSVIPLPGGGAAAHWLVRSGDAPYAYDVVVAVSADGREWGPGVTPHGDGTPTEHGFVSLFPDGGGVGAVWLDGRRMLTAGAAADHDGHHGAGGEAMTLRAGTVSGANRALGEVELDARTCDCCQTAAVLADTGPVVFYRDRDEDEIRDIYAVRRVGGTWGPARRVANDGWRIAGCPVNGPAAAAQGRRLAVTWFTAADDRRRVLAAFSTDGGESYGPPVEVAAGAVAGRADVVLLADGDAVVSWVATDAGPAGAAAGIRYRRVAADGRTGEVRTLTVIDASRSAGFPQIAIGGDGLVFAWTAPGDPADVRSASVPVPR